MKRSSFAYKPCYCKTQGNRDAAWRQSSREGLTGTSGVDDFDVLPEVVASDVKALTELPLLTDSESQGSRVLLLAEVRQIKAGVHGLSKIASDRVRSVAARSIQPWTF